MRDYSNLFKTMDKQRHTRTSLAKEVGLSRQSLGYKLNGKVDFTQSEMIAICDALKISHLQIPKYFFN